MSHRLIIATAVTPLLLLAACGGGGGSGTPAAAAPDAPTPGGPSGSINRFEQISVAITSYEPVQTRIDGTLVDPAFNSVSTLTFTPGVDGHAADPGDDGSVSYDAVLERSDAAGHQVEHEVTVTIEPAP